MTSATTAPPEAEDLPGVTRRHRPSDFYHERTNFQFIKHTRRWLIASSTLLVLSLVLLGVRGLNLGIDFEGGAVYEVPSDTLTVNQARDALGPLGIGDPKVQELQSSTLRKIRVQTATLDPAKAQQVQQALADAAKVSVGEVNRDEVTHRFAELRKLIHIDELA